MKTYLAIVSAFAIVVFACCSPKKNQKSPQQTTFESQQDSIDKKVKATEAAFKQQSNSQLASALEVAAMRGEEPFNSGAFREIITRKDAAPTLFASITDTTQKQFFKLMALKKIDSRLYDSIQPFTSISILTTALQKSTVFNGWGIPGFYWESSAKALISFGAQAKPQIERLLSDTRPAPVWGSEEVQEYQKYKFRVCDYAFGLLHAIDNDESPLPVSPEERDKLIARYIAGGKP